MILQNNQPKYVAKGRKGAKPPAIKVVISAPRAH
jgi:hypothetical protein